MTDNEKHILLHMTDSVGKKRGQGFRNYGAFSLGTPNHAMIERLASQGFARKYLTHGGMDFYFVTVAGCEAIGMTKAGIKRATKHIKTT